MGYTICMKKIISLAGFLFVLPLVSHAQTMQAMMINLLTFLHEVFVPALIAIAFLIFVFNAVRYFVFKGHSDEGRENAKYLAIYSITAFVLFVIFWGIINLLASSIGLDAEQQLPSDYVKMKGG